MESSEGKDAVVGLKESLRGLFSGRTCSNWAVLLFFTKQVCLFTLFAVSVLYLHHY